MDKEINLASRVVLHKVFKGFADAVIQVFIPVLIYKSTNNLTYSFLFLCLNYLFSGVLFVALKRIQQKYSLLSVILHIVPLITACGLLSLKLNLLLVILIALLDSLATVLYYGGINTIFLSVSKNVNIARFEGAVYIGKTVFVLLSAYILGSVANSQIFIFICASALYIMCVIPLLKCKSALKQSYECRHKLSFKECIKSLKSFNIYHVLLGILYGFTNGILPVYIFINGFSFKTVGIIVAIGNLFKLLSSYVGQFFISKKKVKLCIFLTASIIFGCCIAFILSTTPIILYIGTLLVGFAFQCLAVSMLKLFADEQKNTGDYYNALVVREMFQQSGRGLICLLYLILPSFLFVFIFGTISSVGVGLSANQCTNRKYIKDKYISNKT